MKILNKEIILKKVFVDLDIDLMNGKLITIQTWDVNDKANDYYSTHWKVYPEHQEIYDALSDDQKKELETLIKSVTV